MGNIRFFDEPLKAMEMCLKIFQWLADQGNYPRCLAGTERENLGVSDFPQGWEFLTDAIDSAKDAEEKIQIILKIKNRALERYTPCQTHYDKWDNRVRGCPICQNEDLKDMVASLSKTMEWFSTFEDIPEEIWQTALEKKNAANSLLDRIKGRINSHVEATIPLDNDPHNLRK